MSKKLYEKWLSDGPDSLNFRDVGSALSWRDANPSESLDLRRAHEARLRDEERRVGLVETARRKGASPHDAARLADYFLAEEQEKAVRSADDEAKHADRLRLHNNF